MLERVLCRMQAFRATPPHPILASSSNIFWGFPLLFRTVFGIDFLMVFSCFYLPFFNVFSMNFRSISHHSFRFFLGMFFRSLSCRFSPFFEILLFRRPAFYTVNTMVFTHSALAENLNSALEKTKIINFSINFETVFASNFHQFSGT